MADHGLVADALGELESAGGDREGPDIVAPGHHEPLGQRRERDGQTVSGGMDRLQEEHGLSRALCLFNLELRPSLKKAGLLVRDSRMKERKKYGQRGARARFQFSKR